MWGAAGKEQQGSIEDESAKHLAPSPQRRHRLADLVGAVSNVIPAKAGAAISGAMPKQPCTYILASKRNGTLYTGVTSNLFNRTAIHKQDLIEGFSKRYGVHRLVYYEMHETMEAAIRREKQIKKWYRAWKIRLIESMNPEWNDLFDEFWGAINDGPADIARQGVGRPHVER